LPFVLNVSFITIIGVFGSGVSKFDRAGVSKFDRAELSGVSKYDRATIRRQCWFIGFPMVSIMPHSIKSAKSFL
jgi:hypothetical protein